MQFDHNTPLNELPPKPLQSTQQELAFLRDRLSQLEANMVSNEKTPDQAAEKREEVAHALVSAYHETPGIQVLDHAHAIPQQEVEQISLNLQPEEHDDKMEELYAIMISRGVKNALSVVNNMHDPHLLDDFHRFLAQYLAATDELPGIKNTNKNELFASVNMTLFEITLPRADEEESRSFKEQIAMMEQLYAGLQSLAVGSERKHARYSLEIALAAGSNQVVFYASIPNEKVNLFEKQVLGLYNNARIEAVPDDYNVFTDTSVAVGAYATPLYEEILTINTYDMFEADPIDVLLNVFSKLDRETEGAALQFIISPVGDTYIKEYGKVLDKVRKGEKLKDVLSEGSLGSIAKNIFTSSEKKEEEKKEMTVDQQVVENITKKVGSTIVETNIRVIAAAPDRDRAESILADVQSAFNQFTATQGNGVEFKAVAKRKEEAFFRSFSFREPTRGENFRLNIRELATLYHFPASSDSAPQLKQSQAATAPAPLEIPTEGILLGYNEHRGVKTEIRMTPTDRFRHFYVIGQTGVGKSGTLLNMVRQDIENGDGLCYIDPHGSDVQRIMGWIPEHRMDDVIYFDPAHMERPMGLNMLEYDTTRAGQKTLVIDELMGIFNQLFDMKAQGGAMFQQYFKNSAFLVMDHPESGNTLLEITRVLGDKSFRDMKMKHCKNPIVKQFWINAEKTTGDQSLANFVPYISSKFDPLISNEILRPVIAQERSAFNVRDIMDNKKILLVNLSKGRLGEINANLIGLILVGKIQMAALGRADSYGEEYSPFYLYIDEFQNVTTPSIESILSEARKYKLSINMAHQFMAQLDDGIKNAVLGNVGNMQIFRINADDAKTLESRIAPTFEASDVAKLPNMQAYMSLLINGEPAPAFNMKSAMWPEANEAIVPHIKEMSYLKYGRPRDEVEAEIMAKYDKMGGSK